MADPQAGASTPTHHDREMLDVPTEAPTPPHSAGAEYELQGVPEPEARSQWQLFIRRFMRHRMAVLSLLLLFGIFVLCFGAKWLAPFDQNEQDLLLGPVSPTGDHWFGTDELGRDQLTEILFAGQISLKVGLAVALISTVVGTTAGATAGFFGGAIDQFVMRITDLFLVIPAIALLAIAIKTLTQGLPVALALLGLSLALLAVLAFVVRTIVRATRNEPVFAGDYKREYIGDAVLFVIGLAFFLAGPASYKVLLPTDVAIISVLGALGWMYIARVVRGQVLSIKEKEYVEAARASGASDARIIVKHVLPNTIGPILVNATLGIAAAVVIESTLSFLGFGVQPPTTSWGRMLADARGNVGTDKAHLIYFPGLALLVTVLTVNFIGDGLRDAFDPESRR